VTAATQAVEIQELQAALERARAEIKRLRAALDEAQAALVDQTRSQHETQQQDEKGG
jgi:predicted RNase H-like nuclease (RuvC/YqgF family)